MRYNLIKTEFDDFNIFNRNKLNYRAYYIPFNNEEEMQNTTYLTERYNSSMVKVLNGEWQFKYYSKCADLPDDFNTDTENMDTVTLPCTWQRSGYENPVYLNTRYEFKMKPPVIPKNIPVAVYAKKFTVDEVKGRYILTFLGVCSNIGLYVNGINVGYSEGSHNSAEFDITNQITIGENEILVTVYKWCNGSYLECQDMFRENGIFRDVYLTNYNESYLYDYAFETKYIDNSYNLTLTSNIFNPKSDAQLSVKIFDAEDNLVVSDSKTCESTTIIDFKSLNVKEWNAEAPYLYRAVIEYKTNEGSMFIRAYIGFKHIEIDKEIFKFNNQIIKFKGVNHHDSDPKNGWCMTVEELLRDVEIIKDYNCNAIRMSHYPPDPILITICDMYGLYVIDEMDLECHNIYSNPLNARFGRISDNLAWEPQFIDRAKAMYYRDRNHPSITMWSLGNEAGGEKCHDKAYEFFKSVSDIPVHYEGVIHTKRKSYDVVSNMYPHMDTVQRIIDGKAGEEFNGKPFFMCEYCHAMGVGPGGLGKYMDLIYSSDKIMGGCIWEFVDHAVLHTEENAPYKYTYGGDHGEKKHDGNFCVDGLFFPDRTPSTGALNMREVYRPLLAQRVGKGLIKFTNKLTFIDSSDIAINYDVYCNTMLVKSGTIDIIVPPNSSDVGNYEESEYSNNCDNYIVITYTNKTTGKYIASEQLVISKAQFNLPETMDYRRIEYKLTDGIYTVNFDKGIFVFNSKTSEILSYKCDDVELINKKPLLGKRALLPNICRGYLDNDRFIKILWVILGYDKAKLKCKGSKVTVNDTSLTIVTDYSLRFIGKLASVQVKMEITSKGKINVDATIKRGIKLIPYSELPRFGLTLEMPKEFENIEYYGLGDRETLCDFNEHGILGVYNTSVSDMHERYIKPQESGNRSEVRYVDITNNDGVGIKVVHKGNYLNFNANHFVLPDLLKAKHTEDLVDKATTNLQIDGFYRGTGSNSCGPLPEKDKLFNLTEPLHFEFTIIPIKK